MDTPLDPDRLVHTGGRSRPTIARILEMHAGPEGTEDLADTAVRLPRFGEAAQQLRFSVKAAPPPPKSP